MDLCAGTFGNGHRCRLEDTTGVQPVVFMPPARRCAAACRGASIRVDAAGPAIEPSLLVGRERLHPMVTQIARRGPHGKISDVAVVSESGSRGGKYGAGRKSNGELPEHLRISCCVG